LALQSIKTHRLARKPAAGHSAGASVVSPRTDKGQLDTQDVAQPSACESVLESPRRYRYLGLRYSEMGKFSVTMYPSSKATMMFTSNSTRKESPMLVGHVKMRGKII